MTFDEKRQSTELLELLSLYERIHDVVGRPNTKSQMKECRLP